ncbi:hypothetical protein ACFWY6_03425 [Streptomyces sp. NPDC059037]|uniref:hypothetical protein n=1 Tax=Streptomyces sp. NPDC059037 TaxID=3346710 RepID=UPI0036C83CBE
MREAGALTARGADQAEVIWSGCSALAHGDTYGTLGSLEHTVVEKQGQLPLVRFTGSTQFLRQATGRSVAMMQRGFTLFQERAACHY